MIDFKKYFYKFLPLIVLFFSAVIINAQSNDQNFPTPIISNQLSGTVKARPIGDARITTYYFTFNGTQGDIFINVVTKNLNGDIDIFTVDGLRPLTKIVVYSDSSENETGRVIYLRKPEKILLRVQGRTPNDDPATFQFKFAGSFVASTDVETEAPKLAETKRENDSGVIVNEVGTIIEVKPKPTPQPKEPVVEKTEEPVAEKSGERKNETEEKPEEKPDKPKVVVSENLKKKKEKKPAKEVVKKEDEDKNDEKETEIGKEEKEKPEVAEKETVKKRPEKPKKITEAELENIRLVVLLKNGEKIERPMSEVLKFGVEKGVLTVIIKDGTIARYSILDVESVTIK